jgi:hypothetical protein
MLIFFLKSDSDKIKNFGGIYLIKTLKCITVYDDIIDY